MLGIFIVTSRTPVDCQQLHHPICLQPVYFPLPPAVPARASSWSTKRSTRQQRRESSPAWARQVYEPHKMTNNIVRANFKRND